MIYSKEVYNYTIVLPLTFLKNLKLVWYEELINSFSMPIATILVIISIVKSQRSMTLHNKFKSIKMPIILAHYFFIVKSNDG